MENKSIFEMNVKSDEKESLKHDLSCETLVIGGGITGVLIAYKLMLAGIDVVLVEKNTLGSGKTAKSTAVVTFNHDIRYTELISKYGEDMAREIYTLNHSAIEEYKKLSDLYDFDFEEISTILYSKEEVEICNEIQSLKKLGASVEELPKENPYHIENGMISRHQAQINPLLLIEELSKLFKCYEHTKIVKLHHKEAITEHGAKIKFDNVVVATNFPFINRRGLYNLKLIQNRSFVGASPLEEPLEYAFQSTSKKGIYARQYQDHLLLGGFDSKCGNCTEGLQKIEETIESKTGQKPDYLWSNQDTVSLDGLPYIGHYSMFTSNWYVATGFNLWGMTYAMISSNMIRDFILHREHEKSYVFNPSRNMLTKNLWSNVKDTLVTEIEIGKPRCTHLGGALTENKEEHTFECKCHGSRFDENGKVLDSPAMKDKVK